MADSGAQRQNTAASVEEPQPHARDQTAVRASYLNPCWPVTSFPWLPLTVMIFIEPLIIARSAR